MKNKKRKFVHAVFAGISLGAILTSFLLISGSMTGNVVGNMTQQGSSLFGGLLFIIGVTGLFTFLREKF